MKKLSNLLLVIVLLLSFVVTTTSFATDMSNGNEQIENTEVPSQDEENVIGEDEEQDTTEIEWTDVSNVTFDAETYSELRYRKVKVSVNNLEYKEDHDYYIHFSNEKETMDLPYVNHDNAYENGWYIVREGEDDNIDIDEEILEKNAPIYVYFCETVFDSNIGNWITKILIDGKEIERTAQLPLGNKITAYFFNDETSTFCYEPISEERKENIQINYKIGTITDNDILRSIQRGDSDCLEKLMEYAKSATNGKTGSVKLGNDKSITNSLGLMNDAYYYVYMELDDENGEYYPVEDVSLYQAIIGEDIGINLFDYLSAQFKWNLDDNPGDITPDDNNNNNSNKDDEEDDTTAPGNIPQTGATITLVATLLIIAVTGTIVFIKYRKMRGIK